MFDDDGTDIFKSNIIDRYCDRPDSNFMNRKFAAVDKICLAEFAAYHYKDYNSNLDLDGINDTQPETLTDTIIESLHNQHKNQRFPHVIKLMASNETMKLNLEK